MKSSPLKSLLAYIFVLYVIALFIFVFWASNIDLVEPEIEADEVESLLIDNVQLKIETKAPDFAAFSQIPERKQAFFGYFRPIIHLENLKILQERKVIEQIEKQWQTNQKLGAKQNQALEQLTQKYKVERDSVPASLEELKQRVNIIPAAMALAQAASESAWGTSRFAQRANNYFGQWCFKAGCGLVPRQRNEGAVHEVAKFKSPLHSVHAYFKNINTHPAYEDLRKLRAELDKNGEVISGTALVAGLKSYSERGEDYIKELRSIIRFNKLEPIPTATTATDSATSQDR